MIGFFFNLIFFLTEASAPAAGGESKWQQFLHWWETNADPYLNYPGFEAWKFINLAIFVYILYRLLRAPVSNAFKAKREEIRADLIRAQAEKDAALAKLTETEAKMAGLDNNIKAAQDEAKNEAKAEKARIAKEAEDEVERLREQAANDINRSAALAKLNLRRYSAEESIRLAEELIKSKLTADADAKLVKANIQTIGGLN